MVSAVGRVSNWLRSFSTSRVVGSLDSLAPAPGSTRQQNRVGRGPGSGRGKTSGRGQKGQKARHSVNPWFEGGQTPITQLFPKVGFRSKLPQPAEISLGRIQQLIDQGRLDASKPITMRELYRSRALGNVNNGIKILGAGAELLKQPLHITATKASAPARAALLEGEGSFTAHYYSPLGLRAHTRPEATLQKYARLPLRARPTDRRNIEYYRDPENLGYLVDAPNPPQVKNPFKSGRVRVSPLAAKLAELEAADPSATRASAFELNSAKI